MALFTQEQKKAIQPQIKALLKEYGLKGSLSVQDHCQVTLTVRSGNINFNTGSRGYESVNHFNIESNYEGSQKEFLLKARDILNSGNYDNSDHNSDYCDVGHYIAIKIGDCEKPYEFTGEELPTVKEVRGLTRDFNRIRFDVSNDYSEGCYFGILFNNNELQITKFDNWEQKEVKTYSIFSAVQAFSMIKPILKSKKYNDLLNSQKVYKNHKHYELCKMAHYYTSFSPEKRAVSGCIGFDSDYYEFKKAGASVQALQKLESLFIDWQHKKSRCLSSMITGPANFPVRRNEKANNAEYKSCLAYTNYFDKVIKKIKDAKFKSENPDSVPVRSDDKNAKEKLEKKLEKCVRNQEIMKKANALVRAKDKQGLIDLLGDRGLELLEPDPSGRTGFASYALSNNLAEIKRLEGRLKKLDRIEARGTIEINVNQEIKLVQCSENKRVYFEFVGIPNPEIRTLLKSNGFKWTPSKKHWGRVITPNALYATNKRVLPKLKELVA